MKRPGGIQSKYPVWLSIAGSLSLPAIDEGRPILIKPLYLQEFEERLATGLSATSDVGEPQYAPVERGRLGVFVSDVVARRIVEGAAVQLELQITELEAADFKPLGAKRERSSSAGDAGTAPDRDRAALGRLTGFEMVIADETAAASLRAALGGRRIKGEAVDPAIVAVRSPLPPPVQAPAPLAEARGVVNGPDPEFDGVLQLPIQPVNAVAQLSLLLYAHRAFARRYSDALEELHLNRRIFRSVTSGISVANATLPDLPLIYVNPAFEVMTGYCLEEVHGKNCRFLQGPESDQPAVTLLREAIRDGREVLTVLKNFRKDGSPFWNELSLSPIRNREGELTHFVGIQTDVTARVEFEAALRESEKLAAVGRLASSIAHEINNPLESVMNLLYLAQQTPDETESRRYVAMADQEVQRVALITLQSLRFYKQSTRSQAITAAELLRSVLDLYQSRAHNSHIEISFQDRATRAIVCLESEIRQVLNNLVRNALDAMHAAGGRLLIRTRDAVQRLPTVPGAAAPTEVQGVLITVGDTGSGISPETMRQMYKPFFTTKGIAGTGLGLWISSEIIARHGGTLRVRSSQRPGRMGTVFELFLPLGGSSLGPL